MTWSNITLSCPFLWRKKTKKKENLGRAHQDYPLKVKVSGFSFEKFYSQKHWLMPCCKVQEVKPNINTFPLWTFNEVSLSVGRGAIWPDIDLQISVLLSLNMMKLSLNCCELYNASLIPTRCYSPWKEERSIFKMLGHIMLLIEMCFWFPKIPHSVILLYTHLHRWRWLFLLLFSTTYICLMPSMAGKLRIALRGSHC